MLGPGKGEPVTALMYTEEPLESLREKIEQSELSKARVIQYHELAHLETWPAKVGRTRADRG